MGIAGGTLPLPFGHGAEAAVDIEGLMVTSPRRLTRHETDYIQQLLEDHLQKLRDETNVVMGGDDEEAAWQGWDVNPDSSSESSESEGWIDVDDGKDDLDISDSEDAGYKTENESQKAADGRADVPDPSSRVSTLATTKVSN